MISYSRFHLKTASFCIVCAICFLLILSFALLHQSTEDNILPFIESEIDSQNAFLSSLDVFRHPVPEITHLKYHQSSAKPCSQSEAPTVLAIVHSSPTHFLHRKAIRQTWGSSQDGVRTVFVVGRSAEQQVWRRVVREAAEYGDVVLVDMPDTYGNLTLKHLVAVRWALVNCPEASLFLKADDDAFVDVRRISRVAMSSLTDNAIACRIVPGGSAPRRSGKWKVTRNDYPFDNYPEYCSGLAYFSRYSALKSLYEAAVSSKVPYLWIDDVFMTGMAADLAGVKRLDLSVRYARTEKQVLQWLNSDSRVLPWMIAEISPRHWPSEAVAIWNRARNVKIKNSDSPKESFF